MFVIRERLYAHPVLVNVKGISHLQPGGSWSTIIKPVLTDELKQTVLLAQLIIYYYIRGHMFRSYL